MIVETLDQVPSWVMMRGVVYPGHEKAPFVKSGYSTHGAIAYRPDDDTLQCHECGGWYQALATHIAKGHRMSTRDYRTKHGLRLGTSLCGRQLQDFHRTTIARPDGPRAIDRERLARMRAVARKSKPSTVNHEQRNERGACRAQLIERLKRAHRELGHTPTHREMAERGIHLSSVLDLFNVATPTELIARIGLIPNPRGFQSEYTSEYLLDALRDFYVARNRVPKTKEFDCGPLPSRSVYKSRFGSLAKAYAAAGLALAAKKPKEVRQRLTASHTRDSLVRAVREFLDANGRLPKHGEFGKGRLPHRQVFRHHFGTLLDAYKTAGVAELFQGTGKRGRPRKVAA